MLPKGTAEDFRVLAMPGDREAEEPREGEIPAAGAHPHEPVAKPPCAPVEPTWTGRRQRVPRTQRARVPRVPAARLRHHPVLRGLRLEAVGFGHREVRTSPSATSSRLGAHKTALRLIRDTANGGPKIGS